MLFKKACKSIQAERILVVNQPVAPSHVRLLNRLAVELMQRGHEVTELRWPLTEQVAKLPTPPNISAVSFARPSPLASATVNAYVEHWAWLDKADVGSVFRMVIEHTVLNLMGLPALVQRWLGTAKTLVDPCVQFEAMPSLREQLIKGNYSLAIIDPIAHVCGWIILNNLDVPYIAVSNFVEFYGLDLASGVPVPMSYVPASLDTSTDRMSFLQRLLNAPMHMVLDFTHDYVLVPTAMALTATQMVSGSLRHLTPKLTLVNGQRHFDDLPRPVTNTLHTFNKVTLRNDTDVTLDEQFEQFVDSDKSMGTVILSMSTTTSTAGMPLETQRHFSKAFLNVWECPQFPNGARVQQHGTGRLLLKNELDSKLYYVLKEMLSKNTYTRAAKKRSAMANDQMRLPTLRDPSMHWVHKVLRHCTMGKNTCSKMLRPRTFGMGGFVYFGLDIFAAVFIVTAAALWGLR